jgi:hypothetical protein
LLKEAGGLTILWAGEDWFERSPIASPPRRFDKFEQTLRS